MRKKRFYSFHDWFLFITMAIIIISDRFKLASAASNSEDDDMDDIYVDLEVDADLLNRLLSAVANTSLPSQTPRPSVVLLNGRSSSQQHNQQQQPVSLLKLPVILHSLNQKSKQLFANFWLFFVIITVILAVLIATTMVLILANFIINRRDAGTGLSRSKKKSTLSFDIIDNGYRQNRASGIGNSGGRECGSTGGGAFRFFHRSSSTQSNLVVDHDYHFEDFSNFNRTYDRINIANNPAASINPIATTNIDEMNDNFYELPYIDASSTNDFKQSTTPPAETVTVLAANPVSKAILARHESLKFKTFSARKFTHNDNSKRNSHLIGLVQPDRD